MPVYPQVKCRSAIKILRKLVAVYSRTYHDPQELESIGYEVIVKILKKPLENKNRNWPCYVRTCLRNAFRNHISRENRHHVLLMVKARKIRRLFCVRPPR